MDNKTLLSELDSYVVGHLEAKRALITLITRSRLRHFQKYMKGMDEGFLLSPMKILLLGASGLGKTHLVESLQRITHFPLIRVDATQMNPAGSSGGIKPDNLKKMIKDQAQLSCDLFPMRYFSVEGAIDRTVVFVDEIDKLGMSFDSTGNWNKHVQSNFLTMFDNKTEFSGVSFVFAGAFTEITKTRDTKHSIGFQTGKLIVDEALLDDQIVRGGLIPELVGRMTHIVELDKFDKDMYMHILTERLLPKKRIDMAAYGIFDLDLTDAQVEEIVEKAVKSNQGVRFLQRSLDKLFLALEFEAGDSQYLNSGY